MSQLERLASFVEQFDDADALSESEAFGAGESFEPRRDFLERPAKILGQVGQKDFRRRDAMHRVIGLAAEFVEPLKHVFHPPQTQTG